MSEDHLNMMMIKIGEDEGMVVSYHENDADDEVVVWRYSFHVMVFSEFATVICCCLILDLMRTEKRKVDDEKIGREEKEGIFCIVTQDVAALFLPHPVWDLSSCHEPLFNHNFKPAAHR